MKKSGLEVLSWRANYSPIAGNGFFCGGVIRKADGMGDEDRDKTITGGLEKPDTNEQCDPKPLEPIWTSPQPRSDNSSYLRFSPLVKLTTDPYNV